MMGKEEKARCGNCRSENVFGMSRVVGYYSIIENWNDSKKAELSDRQKGNYKLSDNVEMKKEEAIVCAR
jgi:ribonucleoside-triphosphate reductase